MKRFIPLVFISWYHLAWVFVAALRCGFPSRKLTVIGVTGTNGKSSVVYLLTRMLEENGAKVAAASSIEFQIAEKRWQNKFKMTMPGRGFHQKFLKDAVGAGCTYAILEVTSEGIAQHRHRFIDFTAAVFLNLSPEHIERHGSYEAYRDAKGKLFKTLQQKNLSGKQRTSIVNLTDKEAAYFLRFPANHYVGFSREGEKEYATVPEGGTKVYGKDVRLTAGGIGFSINTTRFISKLRGAFNVENAIAAVATASAFGVSLKTCAEALEATHSIPGRFEEVALANGPKVIVDYAHTPAALRNVYETAKQQSPYLVCVLGATGGGRDVWKRKVLGEIAAKFCDAIVVTDEDPYDEEPAAIRKGVRDGVVSAGAGEHVEEIPDRRAAIRSAIARVKDAGTVVVTGKGSEPWMVVAHGKKIPWDDRNIAREELARLR